MNDNRPLDDQRLQRLMEDSPEEVPDDRLRAHFQQLLEREKRQTEKKTVPVRRLTITAWLNVAAAVVLIAVGIGIGRFWTHDSQSMQEVAILQHEIEETKALLRQVVDGNLSASQRLQRVRISNRLERADPEIRDVLIRAMNTDDNVNVRIAAIKALTNFTDDSTARTALVQSLDTQEDPFIQLMLIHLLVKIKEDTALPHFEKLIRDEAVEQTVQDEAHRGIFQLS